MIRRATSLLGELLVTAAVVVLLFCAYQLVWTNVEADRASAAALDELDREWSVPLPAAASTPAPGSTEQAGPVDEHPFGAGDPSARLRIPRLGEGWVEPVIEGTGSGELKRGVGHYVETAGPGELGNYALAGHRATNGEPFKDLDRMRPGDEVVVETRTTVYTYVVSAPWRLVSPEQRSVILPVPDRPSARPTKRLITLTTCNPRWASTERLIVVGELRSTRARVA